MTQLPASFLEDRRMRDAARAVLAKDIERLQGSLEEEGIASRVSSGVTSTISTRIKMGARDVLDLARAQAGDKKGVLALLLGAIILWFAREPILDWFDELRAEDGDSEDAPPPDAAPPTAAPVGDPE